MPFLNPAFLWSLVLLGPVFAFYFLKSKPKRRVIPSTHIWKIVFSRIKPNSFLERFQNSFFLLLQTLAIVLVVLATARPAGFLSQGAVRMIVIDISASMQAHDVSPSRFQQAVDRAKALCRGYSGGVGLLTLGDQLELLVNPKEPVALALDTLGKLSPQNSATPSADRVLQMFRGLEGYNPDEIFLLTDTLSCQFPSWFLPKTVFTVENFGTSGNNVAITEAEASWDGEKQQLNVSLSVRNDNATRITAALKLVDFETAGFPMDLDLGPREQVSVNLPPLPLKKCTVSLAAPEDQNYLKTDDVWYFSDPELKPAVAIRAPSDSVLFKLKRAMPLIDFQKCPPEGSASTCAALLMRHENNEDLSAAARRFPGIPVCSFVSGPGKGVPGGILPWDSDQPLFRFANWDTVPPECLHPGELPGIPLLEAVEGVVVSEESAQEGRMHIPRLWIALDQDSPLLAGNIFLPVLLHNVLEYLLKDQFPRLFYRVGDSGLASLWKGQGPRTSGFFEIPSRAGGVVGVNMQAPSESRITPADNRSTPLSQKAGRNVREQAASPWGLLMSLALVVILGEWYLFMRRN